MAATIKVFINNNPPECEDIDLNGYKLENNNLISSAGEALNTSDNFQTSRAVAVYGSGGDFYNDTGAINAYSLSPVGGKVAPISYFEGMRASFVPQFTNTGGSTINVNGLGIVDIQLPNGDSVGPGDINAGILLVTFYDGANFRIIDVSVNTTINPNLIIGGNFSRNLFQVSPLGSTQIGLDFDDKIIADMFRLGSSSPVIGANIDSQASVSDMPYSLFDTESSVMLELTNQAAIATIPANEFGGIQTAIEGFTWAPAYQKATVFQIGVKSSVAGVYSLLLSSFNSTLNIGLSITINTANTWEKKVISVPANPDLGDWNFSSGVGLRMTLVLASGSDFFGTQDTWQASANVTNASQVNWLDTVGNNFSLALIKHEIGTTATSVSENSFGTSDQERFYQKSYDINELPGTVGATSVPVRFDSPQNSPVFTNTLTYSQRMSPIVGGIGVTIYNPITGVAGSVRNTTQNTNIGLIGTVSSSEKGFFFEIDTGVALGEEVTYHWTADATEF